MMEINFVVDGESITRTCREKAYFDGKFDWAVNMLKACLVCDQLTELEREHLALDILDGKCEIRGKTDGDDYGPVYLDEPDKFYRIGKPISDLKASRDRALHQVQELEQKFVFVSEHLSEGKRREINKEYYKAYDEYLYSKEEMGPIPSAADENLLKSFVDRVKTSDGKDYGWLEPGGEFHAVEWGDHQSWARNYLKEGKSDAEQDDVNFMLYPGDVLYDRGWILLHNPAQGIADITRDESRTMTKAQKEFLYDYYKKRGQTTRANAIFREDE